MRFPVLLALAFCAQLATMAPAHADDSLEQALRAVRPQSIQAHMTFLADDLLEGRETGTRGYALAANYVAAWYQGVGLEPAGDAGSYFQQVAFRRTVQVPEACKITLTRDPSVELIYATDFLMRGNALSEASQVEAPLVFVGFGVSAPESGYDDYTDVDVQGKIVVVVRGAPSTFHPDERAYHGSSTVKDHAAASRGAVGMLTLRLPKDVARRPWERSVANANIASMELLDASGGLVGVEPQLSIHAALSEDGAAKVFAHAEHDLESVFSALESGKPMSFPLGVNALLQQGSRHSVVHSANVLGLLQGADPQLKHEVLVFTGHLDHLGMGEPVNGDSIYNGALDNASGIATMIEVARVFTALPERPKRSLLFLAVTGEEKGLLGSQAFCASPTVPIANIVANVNLDMFLMLNPLKDVVAFGAEHSSLQGVVEAAARAEGIETSPDPNPEEVIFVRSDQYSFVQKGVPAVFLTAGRKGESGNQGMTQTEWRKDLYHSRGDDLSQNLIWDAAVTFTRLNVRIGYAVAQQAARPSWNPDDFFGNRFSHASP